MRPLYLRSAVLVYCLLFTIYCFAQDASKEQGTLSLAKNSFEDGFYDLSLTLFNRFLDKFPESPYRSEAHFYIAQCYFYQKKYNDAIKVFENILDTSTALKHMLKPSRTIDAKNIALPTDKLYYWLAETYFKNNAFPMAYHFYEKLVKEYPLSIYNAHSFYSLGWCLFEQGEFQKAKEKFLEFRDKFPQDSLSDEADFKVVECLYNLKNYPELKAHIADISLKVSKNNAVAVSNEKNALLKFYLAESYFYLEDYSSAIDGYDDVLKMTTDNNLSSLACLGLGWASLKHNKYARAMANFEKVLQIQMVGKTFESALLGAALSLQMDAQYDEALVGYERLINATKNPQGLFKAYLGKAELLYELKRYPESVAAYKEARYAAGQYADKEINASTTLYPDPQVSQRVNTAQTEQTGKTDDDTLTWLKVNASAMERLSYGLGLSYLKSENFNLALSEFLALAQNTKDMKMKISSLTKLADIYYESGDLPKAIEIYENILKDYPDWEMRDYLQLDLGLGLLNLKRHTQAIDRLKKLSRHYPESRVSEQAGFYLGKAYYESADYLSSYQQLDYFISKYPASSLKAEAVFFAGLSLKALKRFQEAYDIFKTALTYNQDAHLLADLELQMSDCLDALGRKNEALEKLERLRSKYPDSRILSLVLWRLGEYYFKLNQFDLSRRYLLELTSSYPEASLLDDSYYLLGLSYEKDGRYQEAIDSFMKIKTDKKKIYPRLADLHQSLDKFQEAISYYRLSLKENVGDKSRLQFKLAECLEESGALKEALAEYTRISGDHLLIVKGLLRCAKIYEKQQKWPSAIEIYEKIVASNVEESKFANERIAVIKEKYLLSRQNIIVR